MDPSPPSASVGGHPAAGTDSPPGLPVKSPLSDQLLSLGSSRAVSLALVAAIALLDNSVHWQDLSFVPRGMIDEPCHLATAVVALGTCTRWRGRLPSRRFSIAMLAASVLIDVDHLPLAFGSDIVTAGTPRPYTHALWLVAALAGVHVAARRGAFGRGKSQAVSQVAAGAALGLSAHFLRDVATAKISLWWPVSSVGVQVPYGWYLAAILLLALAPARIRSRAADG